MNEYFKQLDESNAVRNMLKDYIDKLIIYLEQDYELQEFIFPNFKIKSKVTQSIFNTEIMLIFPTDFVYAFAVNLNVDDLPYINTLAVDIKYMLME